MGQTNWLRFMTVFLLGWPILLAKCGNDRQVWNSQDFPRNKLSCMNHKALCFSIREHGVCSKQHKIERLRGGLLVDDMCGDLTLIDDPIAHFEDGYQSPYVDLWDTPEWRRKIRHRKEEREQVKWTERTELGDVAYVASRQYMEYWQKNQHTVPAEIREKYERAEKVLDEETGDLALPRLDQGLASDARNDKSWDEDTYPATFAESSKRDAPPDDVRNKPTGKKTCSQDVRVDDEMFANAVYTSDEPSSDSSMEDDNTVREKVHVYKGHVSAANFLGWRAVSTIVEGLHIAKERGVTFMRIHSGKHTVSDFPVALSRGSQQREQNSATVKLDAGTVLQVWGGALPWFHLALANQGGGWRWSGPVLDSARWEALGGHVALVTRNVAFMRSTERRKEEGRREATITMAGQGSNLEATNCDFRSVRGTALCILGQAKLNMSNCGVGGIDSQLHAACGVLCGDEAYMYANQCSIDTCNLYKMDGKGERDGKEEVHGEEEPASMDLVVDAQDHVSVVPAQGIAASVFGGSRVVVEACCFCDCGFAVALNSNGSMSANECSFLSLQCKAICGQDTGSLELQDCTLEGRDWSG